MTVQERLSPGKYRLRVDDYRRLDEAGVFGGARTELIGGDIIVMNAEYRPHARVKSELSYRLRRAIEDMPGNLYVMDGSIALSEHDLPQPDIVVTDDPDGEGPIPLPSVALVVEISSTTLHRDAGVKATIYAKAAITEYWIVDVGGRTVDQRWAPVDGTYREKRTVRFDEPITAATIAGLTITTDGL